MSKISHNLRIQDYTLDELLGLFDLTSRTITLEQVKNAKKRVLMLHPDKSRLGSEYFLFYKKALEILVQFYEQQNKQNQVLSKENTVYRPIEPESTIKKQVSSSIQKMSSTDFQTKFNALLEENQMGKQIDPKHYEWFKNEEEDESFKISGNVSASNLGEKMAELKQKQSAMVKYHNVQDFYTTRGNMSNAFGDDEDIYKNQYISSDPFGKLKFDDLRKVHKDETILAVSERDLDKTKIYKSVDELNKARSQQPISYLSKPESEKILEERQTKMRDQMLQKEYNSKIKSQDYEEKNKKVLASFLYLK